MEKHQPPSVPTQGVARHLVDFEANFYYVLAQFDLHLFGMRLMICFVVFRQKHTQINKINVRVLTLTRTTHFVAKCVSYRKNK